MFLGAGRSRGAEGGAEEGEPIALERGDAVGDVRGSPGRRVVTQEDDVRARARLAEGASGGSRGGGRRAPVAAREVAGGVHHERRHPVVGERGRR